MVSLSVIVTVRRGICPINFNQGLILTTWQATYIARVTSTLSSSTERWLPPSRPYTRTYWVTRPMTSDRVLIIHSTSRNDPNGYAPRTPHLFRDGENQFEGKWKNPACSRTGANGKTNLVEYAINNTPGTNGYKFDRVVYTTWNVGKDQPM